MRLFSKRLDMKELFAEVVLVIASVFIFRGAWTLLDRMPVMNGTPALWASFVLGTAITVLALHYLLRK